MHALTEKRALVCGSSHGIGLACAVELAKSGAAVTLLSRDPIALEAAAGSLESSAGQRHGFMVADSADPAGLRDVVEQHLAERGGYHILVNNTGGPPSGLLLEADAEALLRGFSNHVVCNQLLVQALLPGMRASGYGRIINIISTSVILPIHGLGVSNTTRGAVANWSRTLAGELAPLGITVNNVLPGYTNTARLSVLFEKWAKRDGITPSAAEQRTVEQIPMRRLAEPREIGAVVAFLASEDAAYVSGVNLPVDGARTAIQ